MHPQGNIFSLLIFYAWIPVALWGAHRWRPAKTAALLLLIPLMFFPERMAFKLPGLPEFGKDEIAIFWLFIAVLLFHRQRFKALKMGKWTTLAIVLILGGPAVTVLLNSDPVTYGSVLRMGHTPYDAVHFFIGGALTSVLPFVLAAAMFSSSSDLRLLFRFLVGAALIYSFFQLVELRFSPQLHRWVYGYHQSYFAQARRGSGFRPMVFMEHGLAVAMFTLMGILASAALQKVKIRAFRVNTAWVTGYLWLILMFSKSTAAFVYSMLSVPLILFTKPGVQLRIAMVLALIVLSYPAVRSAGLVPVQEIKQSATEHFGAERAQSLMTRFENEEVLLERANERAIFGWGTFCRPCIFDPWSGRQTSIRDGDWIITYGTFGVVGFFGKYLLLLMPIFILGRLRRRIARESDHRLLAALALMVGFSSFDLLPNGNFNYLVFALSGALLGCSKGIVRETMLQARMKRPQQQARKEQRENSRWTPAVVQR